MKSNRCHIYITKPLWMAPTYLSTYLTIHIVHIANDSLRYYAGTSALARHTLELRELHLVMK